MANSEDEERQISVLLRETVQLTRSNAVAIQSLTDDLAEFKLIVASDREQAREERQELRQAMMGIANLLGSLDEDRPTILRKLTSIETKVDRLLERGEET